MKGRTVDTASHALLINSAPYLSGGGGGSSEAHADSRGLGDLGVEESVGLVSEVSRVGGVQSKAAMTFTQGSDGDWVYG